MIEIRKAYPTDAYTLVNICDTVWRDEFYDVLPNAILNERIKNTTKRVNHLIDQIKENNRVFVAMDEGEIVGYIFYGKTHNAVYNMAIEIRDIFVLPKYQKQGIGKELFESVRKEIKQLGYKYLIANCPLNSRCITFFLNAGGEKREVVSKDFAGYKVRCDLLYFDLDNYIDEKPNAWNDIYYMGQEYLYLLNNINRELAIVLTKSGKMYLGVGIKNKVCPVEVAIANMHIGEEKEIDKILIMNRQSKPVLPCGKCKDLLISLGQENALILFDFGTLEAKSVKELNPYYKDEEKA